MWAQHNACPSRVLDHHPQSQSCRPEQRPPPSAPSQPASPGQCRGASVIEIDGCGGCGLQSPPGPSSCPGLPRCPGAAVLPINEAAGEPWEPHLRGLGLGPRLAGSSDLPAPPGKASDPESWAWLASASSPAPTLRDQAQCPPSAAVAWAWAWAASDEGASLAYDGDCISADNVKLITIMSPARPPEEPHAAPHSSSTMLPASKLRCGAPLGPAGCEYLINVPLLLTGVFVNMIHGPYCYLS